MPQPTRDRFDEVRPTAGRVGAHRAENPRVRGWTTFLWALAATIVFVVAGLFVWPYLENRGVVMPLPGQTAIAPPPEEEQPPAVEPVVDTSYTVMLMNGTPDEGLAGRFKETLLAAGWADGNVVAGNASQHDFPTTTVYYVAPEAQAAALGLAQVLGGAEVVEDADYPLPGTPVTQLTVVLGLDDVQDDPGVEQQEEPAPDPEAPDPGQEEPAPDQEFVPEDEEGL